MMVTGATAISWLSVLDTRMMHGHGTGGAVTGISAAVGAPLSSVSRACVLRTLQSTEPRRPSLPQKTMLT